MMGRTCLTGSDLVKLCIVTLVAALAALTSTACNKSPSSPSSNGAGVAYSATDLRAGAGTEATNGRRITVNYTGWLYSAGAAENKGAMFDTSVGRVPFTFTLGAGQVIAGWDRGVAGMKVGGLRRLVLPPELAYGATGAGSIPPNSTLVFDVEVMDVQG
jgi:FKBP-type peptidyl-prolyl cis-trans isomerase FkpA